MVKGLINHVPGDMEFTDMTNNHHCSGCASCCTCILPITKKERNVLISYIKEHNIKQAYGSDFDKENCYAFCPLLDPETNKCRAYECRPFVCRNFKCDKKKETLIKARVMYAKRADYNGFGNGTPVASMHFLLYGDYKYDILYRHLLIKNMIAEDPRLKAKLGLKGELTYEDEVRILPMLVDQYIFEKGIKVVL